MQHLLPYLSHDMRRFRLPVPDLLTNVTIYDIRHGIAWPQTVRVCDGISGVWVLCYEPQSLDVRDDIAQQYTGTSVA